MKVNRRAVLNASMLLFAVSLALPAAKLSYMSFWGFNLLLFGPLGVLYGEFRWAANIFLWFSWVKTARSLKPSAENSVSALLALLLALSCTAFPPSVVVGAGTISIEKARLAVGGFVWIAAHVVALIASVLPASSDEPSSEPAA